MRNLFSSKYMYLTAAMLTGAAMFTSCSNEDDMGNVNPTYDGESVKTQFAINIPAAGKADTKMTGDNTQQATGAFLGMQNLKLIPLTATAADGMALTQIISLGNIEAAGLTEQHKIYSDVNIPVGTKNFLFYGEALGTQTTTTTDAFAQGVLKNTITASASTDDITFELLPVIENKNYTAEATTKKAVLDAVNAVAGASGWKTYAEGNGNTDKILTKLYEQFTTFPAGSAASVKLALADLKTSIASLLTGSETENTIAQAINTAIEDAIGDGNTKEGTLKDNTYPTDYNLPVGAAQFSWNNGVATYKEDDASLGETNTVSLDLDKICYPAALSYFVSTDLKATNNSNPQWPTFTNWNGGTWDKGVWDATEVTATTQAVALTKPINYGVALMETAVKCKTETLEDNAHEKGGESQNRIIIVPSAGFPVTGLLIGGQPDVLKWNFKPASDGNRTMTVYDNSVKSVTAGYNIPATKNYTLVLENTKTTVSASNLKDADKVNVAIEMTNNSGGDFYGADGIIKAGATFYLVGQLDITKLGTGGNLNERTSVFEQDYTTVATFTISSLKNAYNCIPDLRGTQLSLGLAVDLDWKDGVIFDVEIQ